MPILLLWIYFYNFWHSYSRHSQTFWLSKVNCWDGNILWEAESFMVLDLKTDWIVGKSSLIVYSSPTFSINQAHFCLWLEDLPALSTPKCLDKVRNDVEGASFWCMLNDALQPLITVQNPHYPLSPRSNIPTVLYPHSLTRIYPELVQVTWPSHVTNTRVTWPRHCV